MLHGIVQEVGKLLSRRPIGYLITFVGPDSQPDLDVWSSRLMADIWADHYREDGCTEIEVSPLYTDRELCEALAEIDARQQKAPRAVDTGGAPESDELCPDDQQCRVDAAGDGHDDGERQPVEP